MRDFKLLISFDGALSVVKVSSTDLHSAMDIVRNGNPDRTAVLVRQL